MVAGVWLVVSVVSGSANSVVEDEVCTLAQYIPSCETGPESIPTRSVRSMVVLWGANTLTKWADWYHDNDLP